MLQNTGFCLLLWLFSYLSSENSPVLTLCLLQAWCLICQGSVRKPKDFPINVMFVLQNFLKLENTVAILNNRGTTYILVEL